MAPRTDGARSDFRRHVGSRDGRIEKRSVSLSFSSLVHVDMVDASRIRLRCPIAIQITAFLGKYLTINREMNADAYFRDMKPPRRVEVPRRSAESSRPEFRRIGGHLGLTNIAPIDISNCEDHIKVAGISSERYLCKLIGGRRRFLRSYDRCFTQNRLYSSVCRVR